MKSVKTLVIAALLLGSGVTFAQEKPLHEVHAAMLYNFIKYTQWPNEAEAGDFTVGVIGEDNLFELLKARYDGKPKGTKKYVIKKLSSAADASACQVVYVGKAKSGEFESINTSVKGKGALVITDKNGLGEKGSAINFKTVDNKLKFELNQKAIDASNLKVSGALSSMAILI